MVQPQFEVTVQPTATFAADFAEFLRLDDAGEIALAQAMRNALVPVGERYTGRVFRPTTFRGTYPPPCFDGRTGHRVLELCKSPVTAVTMVEEHVDGSFATVSDAIVTLQDHQSLVEFPTTSIYTEDIRLPVRVTFTAGYADDSQEREMIDQALKHHLGYVYENRGDVAGDFTADSMPETAKLFYNQLRIIPGFG